MANMLTIGDVYKPTTAAEMMNMMLIKGRMEDQKIQNRMLQVKEQTEQEEREYKQGLMQGIVNGMGVGQVVVVVVVVVVVSPHLPNPERSQMESTMGL